VSDLLGLAPTQRIYGFGAPPDADARLWVRFVRKSARNAYKSDLEGRPIFEPVDYIQIQQPGERDMLMRPVKEEDKLRFPKHWEAFQANTKQAPEGTPVQMLFPNEPHITDMLIDLRILTVEQLAQLSEAGINRLGMDGRKYVARAAAAMDQSAKAAEVSRLTRELTEAQEKNKLMEDQMAQMRARMDSLESRLRQAPLDEPMMFPSRREPKPARARAPEPDTLYDPPPSDNLA
jgi:hypothetical protein